MGAVELNMAQEEAVVERRVRGGVYSPGAYRRRVTHERIITNEMFIADAYVWIARWTWGYARIQHP